MRSPRLLLTNSSDLSIRWLTFQVRKNIEIDRRIFTPVLHSSYTWAREYKKRTAVERVNSRLDVTFGFEKHFIRRLKKMKVRVRLALCVMLAMAVVRIKEGRQKTDTIVGEKFHPARHSGLDRVPGGNPVLNMQRSGDVFEEREKRRLLWSAVFVNPGDTSSGRHYEFTSPLAVSFFPKKNDIANGFKKKSLA